MRIQVKVKAKAKQEKVEKVSEGQYKVWVKAVPEKGRANEAVIEALSVFLEIPKSNIRLMSGQTSAQKTFEYRTRSG